MADRPQLCPTREPLGLAQQVRCLNEAVEGSCRQVFKPWERRLEAGGPVLSSEEDDPELLLHIPFNGAVKLTGITLIGGPDGTSPSRLKVRAGGVGMPAAAECGGGAG